MRNQPLNQRPIAAFTFETTLQSFERALEAKNRSRATIAAYRSDLNQFFRWLAENNVVASQPDRIERADILDYFSSLARRNVSGTSRARKLAAIREYFRHLVEAERLPKSPTAGIETPKREKKVRTYLQPEEYRAMLAEAGNDPRDYAILQVFPQTGVRVAEPCQLRIEDIHFAGRKLYVRGKGMADRHIDLEKKVVQAIKNYLAARPQVPYEQLFLNCDGEPIGGRGVRKIVSKYHKAAEIKRRTSPHTLRHTFATMKNRKGINTFQLQVWLGHASVATTQIYVHLDEQEANRLMEATSL